MHFRNFLGPPEWALCGDIVKANSANPNGAATLNPELVSCERCLKTLGRLRQDHFAAPVDRNK